jgi:hypothetical protein
MARQRRGGGFKPPELRGTLGTLLRTAAAQVGPLRDALESTVREGRARFDDARAGRRREASLAELGEIVLDLIRRGEIDVAELPEVRDIVAHLDEIDSEDHPSDDDRDVAPPPARNRFDSRRRATGRDGSDEEGTVTSRTWKPPTVPRQGQKAPTRVWRPPAEPTDDAGLDVSTDVARPEAKRKTSPPPTRKGGITFEDDDDLADYMHPDDVPPKKSSDEE